MGTANSLRTAYLCCETDQCLAIDMAEVELEHGTDDETRDMAQKIIDAQKGVGTQNGPRYTLRFCRAFDGAHLAKRSERGGWRIGIGPEVIAGEIDMLPTER